MPKADLSTWKRPQEEVLSIAESVDLERAAAKGLKAGIIATDETRAQYASGLV